MENITINTNDNNIYDINYIDLNLYSNKLLSESIVKYNLFYNKSNSNIILLTKDIINDIYMLPCINKSTNTLYNYVLSKCSILKTNDNVYILYYPLKQNYDDSINYNHLSIYYVGEILYNLRLNNDLSDYMIDNKFSSIIEQINSFIQYNTNNIISTITFLNSYIKIIDENIPYGFILWLYFLMKIRIDYINYYRITDFDEKIIECETIYRFYKKLQINISNINKEVIKWFL